MTLHHTSYSDLSSPVTAAIPAGGTSARTFTEPFRELSTLGLLAANAVFLLLGVSGLFFVLDRWGAEFGLRSAAVFDAFVGPVALGLPMLALLLATHVAPILGRARMILVVILAEYALSALFGVVTFLGAFAYDVSTSVRAALEGLLARSVWLALLVLAIIIAARVWLGLFPAPKVAAYRGYPQPAYGSPYPGQPMYTQPVAQPASPWSASPWPVSPPPAFAVAPTSAHPGFAAPEQPESGWPPVPPPPMPGPLVVDADPTMQIAVPGSAHGEVPGPAHGEVPGVTAVAVPAAEHREPPTQEPSR